MSGKFTPVRGGGMSLFDELKSKSAQLQEGEVVSMSLRSSEQPSFSGQEGVDLNQLQKEKPLIKRPTKKR